MMATVTCQNCGAEVEIPVPEHKPRGVLAGKTLEEMSFDELKIERRNAKSVLYKSEKAGVSGDKLEQKMVRVDAVLAEIEKRKAEMALEAATAPEETPATEVVEETIEGVEEAAEV
jgi:hypothetical protein